MMNALSPGAMYGAGAAPGTPGPSPMADRVPQVRPVEQPGQRPEPMPKQGGFMAHQNMLGGQPYVAGLMQRLQQFPQLAGLIGGHGKLFGGGQTMFPGGNPGGAPLQGNPGAQPTGVMPTQPQMMPPQMMPPQAQQGMVGSAYGVTGATPALGGFGLPTY